MLLNTIDQTSILLGHIIILQYIVFSVLDGLSMSEFICVKKIHLNIEEILPARCAEVSCFAISKSSVVAGLLLEPGQD